MSHESYKAVLNRVDGRASWLLVIISLGMLASLFLGENNRVTEALNIVLVFVSGIVLGIIWIRLALRRMGTREEP
jgi:hypothetical protein